MKRRPRPTKALVVAAALLAVALAAVLARAAVERGTDPLVVALIFTSAVAILVAGYREIRARSAAERRADLLATLVNVGHAVGGSLDPAEIFRAVYSQVREVMDADNFYVATVARHPDRLVLRFLVDEGRELAPQELPLEGTVASVAVAQDRALLLRDLPRDRLRIGLSERIGWGTLLERSMVVVPLRIRGAAVGALSAQSVHPNAYDESDLGLLEAIANEAAIAIERADLHERAAGLSRRLFELHRIGMELGAHRELRDVVEALADAGASLIGASGAAVYLDNGGEALEFAASLSRDDPDVRVVPKQGDVARALDSGDAVVHSDTSTMSERGREMLERNGHKAVVMQPLRAGGQSIGILFVAWHDAHEVSEEERELLALLAGIGATTIRSIRLYSELDDAYLSTVSTLTATIQARDRYGDDHQRRVASDAIALGERLGLSGKALRELRHGSLFHALGKIGVPATILTKPAALTPEERRIVQEHPLLAVRILESIRFLRPVIPMVRHAYERWDGSGYPDGIKGEDIPLAARILGVVIAYHAMVADRPYRPAVRRDVALAELRDLAGRWYDPQVVDAFATMIEARGAVAAAEEEVGVTSRELAVLAEITPEFHTLLDVQQLLDRILAILERHMPGCSLTILLREDRTGDLIPRASAGARAAMMAAPRLPAGRGLSGWVMEHGAPLIVDDVRGDDRFVGDETVRSEMVVPLVSGGQAIGVIVVSHPSVAMFAQRDLTLMQTVGAQIAAAIEVADLHDALKRAANTDALTGIHNYRYFYDRLEEEVARAERRQVPLAVAFLDIDKLKNVNDTHGHVAGNAVLQTLGHLIEKRVRQEDVPARYGGDEFAILMPETPREEAEKVVQRLIAALEKATVELPDGTTITLPRCSWGVASYPLDGATARTLLENADTRAYARKRARQH